MNDWIEPRTRIWAAIAVLGGIALFLGIEMIENPDSTVFDLLFELLEISPIVLTSVGTVLLFRVSSRQHDEHLKVIRDLELARAQGHRWRTESRSLLNGLGQAIETQFSRWNLTEASARWPCCSSRA